jgi:hypothetical protein
MGLPTGGLPREKVTLPDGQEVEVRGLNREEALKVSEIDTDDVVAWEKWLLTHGTDTPFKKTEAWYAQAGTRMVLPLVNKILELSGMGNDSGKESGEG